MHDASAEPRRGLPLSILSGELHLVPEHMSGDPIASFDGLTAIGRLGRAYMKAHGGPRPFKEGCRVLPLMVLERLGFDRLCKTNFAGGHLHDTVRDLFRGGHLSQVGPHRLVERISSSMRRWGWGDPDWNAVADAWRGLKAFDLGVPGFEVEIDHVHTSAPRGWSIHSATYLDGALAFLVRWRDRHVMTIGFSFASGRRLLVQQIQTKSRTGNRWMFRFPRNRVEHVLDRFAAAFPDWDLHLVDGASLAAGTLSAYRRAIAKSRAACAMHRDTMRHSGCEEMRSAARKWRLEEIAERRDVRQRIAHLAVDAPRIETLYAGSGRWVRGAEFSSNGTLHHAVRREAVGGRMAA